MGGPFKSLTTGKGISNMWVGIIVSCFYILAGAVSEVGALSAVPHNPHKICKVPAGGSETIDDAPAIRRAFRECNHGGKIVFQNTTYHVNTVLKTTGLVDVDIDLYGTLLVRFVFPRLIIYADSKKVGNGHSLLAQQFPSCRISKYVDSLGDRR